MKISGKIARCNEARALARNLANYPIRASKNDVQAVPGRVQARKIEVGRAKFERKTFAGRTKIQPRAPDEREARSKIEKSRPGVRNLAGPAAPVWNYSIGSLGRALRAPLDVRDKVHTAAAEAAAPAAAPAAALAAAPAADPWIHGSIFFIINHIFKLAVNLRKFYLDLWGGGGGGLIITRQG